MPDGEKARPRRIERPYLLVVEGEEDAAFFEALARHLGLGENLQLWPAGGKDNIRPQIKTLCGLPGFSEVERLGVIRDADADPEAAFRSVAGALKAAGLPVPRRPGVVCGERPRVSVFILPGGGNPGALEDLCLEAVRDDPAAACVEEFFRCLEERLSWRTGAAKAKVQAFLASREEPGKRLGEAALAGYWPWDSPVFEPVREFLRRLFG